MNLAVRNEGIDRSHRKFQRPLPPVFQIVQLYLKAVGILVESHFPPTSQKTPSPAPL